MPDHVLSAEEVSARIKAARLLRGITQDQLAAALHEAGLTWRLAGELERGDQTLLALHRLALARALGFSERWFIVPLDELCPEPPEAAISDQLGELREMIQSLIDRGER